MKRIKQAVRPYYRAIKATFIYCIVNYVLNLFLRHNNLLVALLKSWLTGNKLVLGKNVVLRYCRFNIHGSGNVVNIGNDCKLSGVSVYMNSGKNKLIIGQNTIVNASKRQRTLFNPCNGAEIIIGERCLFSNNIEVHTTDYHKIVSAGQRVNLPNNVKIGNHCWVGLQCLILKGTILADDVVVGAKSLINKKIEESNVIIAGNPVRIVKKDISWDF